MSRDPSKAGEPNENDNQSEKVEDIDSTFSMDNYTKALILSENDFDSLAVKTFIK